MPGIGDTEPQNLSHCAATYHPSARGATGHSQREYGQVPPSPRRHLKASHAKTLGPKLPLTIALTLARPSARGTAGVSDLQAYWGLTLILTPNP